MTDHELLELAAKASGLAGEWSKTLGGWDCLVLTSGNVWQPLHDDGDALRLAVKLGLLNSPVVAHEIAVERFTKNVDTYAATRRAIVKAAAEIGKQVKK